VLFVDANGATVIVEELSDGYRSVSSMTFEVIRQFVTMTGTQTRPSRGRILCSRAAAAI